MKKQLVGMKEKPTQQMGPKLKIGELQKKRTVRWTSIKH